jgi:cytochrome P450
LIKTSNRGYWGDGLTTLEGDPWRTRRRLIQPAFHEARIENYGKVVVECAGDMVERWQPGQVVNLDEAMLTLTARIAARILFDAELEGFESPAANESRSGMIRFEEAVGEEFTATRRRGDSTLAYLTRRRAGPNMDTTLKIIHERFASGEDRGDMLSFLLNATAAGGGRLTRQEVIGEILQMFFAGHHTIPTTLLWLWVALWQHPEVEARVYEELDRVLRGRRPTVENLPHLPYGEMVIKETMRFYPLAAMLPREVIEDVQLGDYTVKQGATVWVSPYLLHRDSRNFEEPERFWPERFSPERAKRISKFAYLPFGAGPRICIGSGLAMLELELVLATVAQSYRLSLAPDHRVVPKVFLTIRPESEIHAQVSSRLSKEELKW